MAAVIPVDYHYKQLTPGSRTFRAIRLLQPLRSWFNVLQRETLRLQIEHIEVDSGRPYECLSYTWGVATGQSPHRRIIVETEDGPRQLFIHRPLEAALLQIVKDKRLDGLLFVDQICLDQSNDVEKSHQVPLMKDIYAKCRRAIVWLGPGTQLSDCYMDFVRVINKEGILSRLMSPKHASHFLEIFDAVMDCTMQTSGIVREDADDLRALLEKHGKLLSFRAMEDVFSRPWFLRLWIIQEVCLPMDILIICGSRAACLDCFRGGNLFFSTYSTFLARYVDRKVSKDDLALHWKLFDLTQAFMRIYQERRAIHRSGKRQTPLDAVLRYSVDNGAPKIAASRPEDRIYGVMGLMAPDAISPGMAVTYDNVARTYTEFAAQQVKVNVDLLCYSQFPKVQSQLPSWVPDWTMALRLPRGYTKLEEPRYSAGTAPGHASQASVDLTSEVLAVRGVVVDRITSVGKMELGKDPEFQSKDQIDSRSVKLFFDEIDDFVQLADATPDSRFRSLNPDEERRADAAMRLADFGLSERYLLETQTAEEVRLGLRAARAQVVKFGQMLLDVDAQVRSFRMDRIFKTVGITPWYWVPAGEVDICHAMASDPVWTSMTWMSGAALFALDVAGLYLASSLTIGASHVLRLKRRYMRMELFPSQHDERLRRLGLDASVDHSEAVSTLNDFMLKNTKQRLYVTEQGYVGLGPRTMLPQDVIMIPYGATVPHVLRAAEDGGQGEGSWTYLGEAYCDGIMNGELLKGRGGVTAEAATFRIA